MVGAAESETRVAALKFGTRLDRRSYQLWLWIVNPVCLIWHLLISQLDKLFNVPSIKTRPQRKGPRGNVLLKALSHMPRFAAKLNRVCFFGFIRSPPPHLYQITSLNTFFIKRLLKSLKRQKQLNINIKKKMDSL